MSLTAPDDDWIDTPKTRGAALQLIRSLGNSPRPAIHAVGTAMRLLQQAPYVTPKEQRDVLSQLDELEEQSPAVAALLSLGECSLAPPQEGQLEDE